MALPDYQDPSTGDYYPGPDPAEDQARREAEARERQQRESDAARRAFIRDEYRHIMGIDPSDDELNDAYDRYMRGGGDAMRAWLSERAGSGGGQPAGGGLGDLVSFPGMMRPNYNFSPAPGFEFSAPTEQDIYTDPSFEFRRGLGQKGIEASASARGLLRSGGTLKDILGFNQKFASQEYGNIYDRRFREAQASYAPKFNEWMFTQGAQKDAADKEWQRVFDAWQWNNPSASEILRVGAGV